MPEGAFRNAETVHDLYNLPAPQPSTSHSLDLSYCFKNIYYPGDSEACQFSITASQQATHLRMLLPPTARLLTCESAYKGPGCLIHIQSLIK